MSLQTVRTRRGIFNGAVREGYTLFAGIPYAKAPVGARRFQKPELFPETQETFEAAAFAPICHQERPEPGSFYEKEFYQGWNQEAVCSEDCLYLNVWTPAVHTEEKLPVLFWVHGGAFNHGYGHEIAFDGAAYCKRGVILVTINYRLGIWGFLSHPEINGGIGSLAIRDQICALDWVYENIAAFGGNPQAITIAGQSAGAYSIEALLTSEMTGGKIAGAIMQSGGCINPGFRGCMTQEQAWEKTEQFCKNHGIEKATQLLDMPPEELQQIAGDFPSGLTIDGEVLKQDCNEAMQDGKYPHVPYLVGSNSHDLGVTKEMLERQIPSNYYKGTVALAEHGERLDVPVYVYFFAHALPGDEAGAFHSAELWYMFGTLNRCWRPVTEADYELSERMLDCWSAFVKTGSPDTGKRHMDAMGQNHMVWNPLEQEGESWPVYHKDAPFVKEF